MPYYHTCPLCGAALDPGERCDCRRMQSETAEIWFIVPVATRGRVTQPVEAESAVRAVLRMRPTASRDEMRRAAAPFDCTVCWDDDATDV